MAWGILSKQYIVFEFLYGLIIGWLYIKDRNYFNYGWLILIVGTVFFCTTIFFKHEYVGREISLGIPSALIVYGLLGLRQYKIALLTSLGDASYSIYLVQIFTIAVYYKTLKFFPIPEVFNDVLVLGCLFFTAVCGLILHATIEKTVSDYVFKFKRYL
jgi:peptidoglycan/LPS O-acetylase OafA/YrhL